MTPAAELWAAVVKHCATGRGYRIEADSTRLKLDGGPIVYVEPSDGGWIVVVGSELVASLYHADEAVRAALRIVAPNTESR